MAEPPIYVAEHAPHGKRGFYTSWIQTTATLGLFLSLLVILACREWIDAKSFDDWGWRIPFLLSILLLAISVYIRLRLNESPLFQRMKDEGRGSTAPLTEALPRAATCGSSCSPFSARTAGQGVVWYAGQFYALFFLTQTLKVDPKTAILMVAAALAIGTPGFILFGWLSDRVGRKPIIMLGCLLAVISYLPLFKAITHYANPALEAAIATAAGRRHRRPGRMLVAVQSGRHVKVYKFVRRRQERSGQPWHSLQQRGRAAGQRWRTSRSGRPRSQATTPKAPDAAAKAAAFGKALGDALKTAGYPAKADPARINHTDGNCSPRILVIYVTLVYGPIAAMLVEMFPTRIRYTSVSLPYHFGNGWFGGFLPAIAFAIVAATGNIYNGLWYPIAIAAMTLVIGVLFLRETKDVDIRAG